MEREIEKIKEAEKQAAERIAKAEAEAKKMVAETKAKIEAEKEKLEKLIKELSLIHI